MSASVQLLVRVVRGLRSVTRAAQITLELHRMRA
jgi:hypothetical protein